ncbi:MAG: hypothetical protein WD749_06360 [Phycisphaerales bacterium]
MSPQAPPIDPSAPRGPHAVPATPAHGGQPAPDLLIPFLALRDTPCPACTYNLRGLTGAACPECGAPLELRVGLTEPRMALWIAGLVGLAAGAGFNTLLLVYVAIRIVSGDRPGGRVWMNEFVLHNLIAGVLEGAMLGAWLLLRRPIRRLPMGARGALVALAWACAAVNVLVFSALIR